MTLLVQQYTLNMNLLDKEIESLNEQYQHVFETPSFSDRWKEIKERLEVMNKDIVIKKQKEFNLDKLAFSQGYDYKWSNRSGGRGQGRKPNTYGQSHADSSLSRFSLSQAHNRLPEAQASRLAKRTRHGGGSSPSDPKNALKGLLKSKERATSGNLTPALQNIFSKGASNAGSNRSTLAVGDILDPALALLETKKQGNLSPFVLRLWNSQTPQVNPN